MTGPRLAAQILVAAGVLTCMAASVAALVSRRLLDRIHFVAPVTSVGAPLIGVGLAVDTGWHLASALILFTVLVLAVTGPALAAATARVDAQREGIIRAESPE